MKNLNFYLVDLQYVDFLKQEELNQRGFTRVPNLDYGNNRKPKFLCGIVLKIDSLHYFAPVSSFKQKKPDNFLIQDKNGNNVASLRFNYMFPIPLALIKERKINEEPDSKYRNFLFQELKFCQKNSDSIYSLAIRTYKRVLLGKDKGLVHNSCDFKLLERKYMEWEQQHSVQKQMKKNIPSTFAERLATAQKTADQNNESRHRTELPKEKNRSI